MTFSSHLSSCYLGQLPGKSESSAAQSQRHLSFSASCAVPAVRSWGSTRTWEGVEPGQPKEHPIACDTIWKNYKTRGELMG